MSHIRSVAPALARRPWHAALAALALGLALAEAPVGACALAALASLGLLAACGAPATGALAAALVLAGAAAGAARLDALDAPARAVRDGPAALRGHLLTAPRPSAFGSTAELRVSAGRLKGARLFLRVARWSPLPAAAAVGSELAVSGRIRALQEPGGSRAEGGGGLSRGRASGRSPPADFDFADHLRRRGVGAELLLERAHLTGRRRAGPAGALDRLREHAAAGVAAGLPRREAALARGMVLGQDEAIDAGTRDDFRESGLAHLLAVSGQNVMLLMALAVPLLAAARLGPLSRGAALTALVAMYVPLAGAGPSLQRAGVMGVAGVAAITLSRPSSRWYALLLAAVATLALNPRSWADAGWQMSFAAVAGILVLGPPLARGLRRLARELSAPSGAARDRRPGGLAAAAGRGLADGAAITIAAGVATAPLLAHHFGSVPLVSLPANLLALPAVAPAMWTGMVRAALGMAAPVLPGAAWLAEVAEPVARLPLAYLAWLAARFADVPHGQLRLPLGGVPALLAAYVAVAAAALGVRAAAGRLACGGGEAAAAWRRRPRQLRAAAWAAAAAALALLLSEGLAGPGPPSALTVRFLDVGQGDATLVQHPDGSAILFDGGPPEAGTARLLRRAGVRELSLVVATHASRDHHGGLREVLTRFRTGLLLDGGDGTRDSAFGAMLEEAQRRGVPVRRAVAPMSLAVGSLRVRILGPAPRPPGPPPEDPNPRAVVAIVSSGGFDLLLSADAESPTLLPLALPDVDAMKVPHHGSADPGLPRLLERLRPELAAIEVGSNTYGHPAPSTLAALSRTGARVYRTDRDGTIAASVAGTEMRVATEG